MATSDPYFVQEALQFRDDLHCNWLEVKEVLDKYPDLFTPEVNTKQVFLSMYS